MTDYSINRTKEKLHIILVFLLFLIIGSVFILKPESVFADDADSATSADSSDDEDAADDAETVTAADPTIYTEGTLYYRINADGSVTITGCFSQDSEVTIPQKIAGRLVVGEADGSFTENRAIEKVHIIGNIYSYNKAAFGDWISVTISSPYVKVTQEDDSSVDPAEKGETDTVDEDVVDAEGPTITSQPTDIQVKTGAEAVFKVVAKEAASYQWQYSKNGGSTWKNCSDSDSATAPESGTKTDTLTMKATTARFAYLYRCKVTGTDGTAAYTDSVRLLNLAITQQPVSVCVAVGKTAVFNVAAEGAVSYQWQYSKDGGSTWKNCSDSSSASAPESGTKTDTLTMKATTARYWYSYRCMVTGKDGSVLYTEAVKLLKFAITQQPDSVYADTGKAATFSVKADNAVSYQWQYSKNNGSTWKNCTDSSTVGSAESGTKTDTLTMIATKARFSYLYRCKVTGADGTVRYTVSVQLISGKPVITTQPVSVTAAAGDSVTFTVAVKDTDAVSSYRWQYSKDGGKTWGSLSDNTKASSLMSGTQTDTITMKATTARKAMCFRCRLIGKDGTAVYTDTVTIG